METLLKEIERALEAHLYYPAVILTLALPDMCAAVESPDGETSGDKYRAWYDAHLAAKFPAMTAADCYRIRCGVVHQGRFGFAGKQFGRVIFTLPNEQRVVINNGIINDALQFDANWFCRTVLSAVRDWHATAQNNPIVVRHMSEMIQLRPMGMKPYIHGCPIIA